MPKISGFHRTLALLLVAVALMALPGCQAAPDPGEVATSEPTRAAPTSQPAPATPRPTSTPAPVVMAATPTVVQPAATPATNVKIAAEKGAQAPNFKLTDIYGTEIMLGDLRGKVVLLNFWTTW